MGIWILIVLETPRGFLFFIFFIILILYIVILQTLRLRGDNQLSYKALDI